MLKTRLTYLAATLAVAGAVSCSSNSPSSGTQTAVFTQALLPANEVPAASGPETAGSGNSTITLTYTTDSSGNVTGATATFVVTLTNFPAGTNVTMAHIHEGAVGVQAPVLVSTGLVSGDVVFTNGAGGFTKASITVPSDVATRILNNPASFYFNVHTAANPPGVARGQMVRTQ
jgi:hypothetical protein